MSDGDLPAYAQRPGEQVLGPPYVAKGARLYLLFVEAKIDRLNDLIDKSLNAPLLAHFGVTPAFQASRPKVIFMFANIPQMYSGAHEYLDGVKQHHRENKPPTAADVKVLESTLGEDFVREVEVSVWVPIVRTVYGQQTPGFYLPFVFNDSPASIATGREVYGYPKQLASIVCTPRSKPSTIKLQTSHIPKDTKKPGEYKSRPLLQISLPGIAAPPENLAGGEQNEGDIHWKEAAAKAFGELTAATAGHPRLRFAPLPPGGRQQEPDRGAEPDRVASRQFAEDMISAAPLYFLRQFRDPVHPGRATDQRLIEARFVIQREPKTSRIHGGAEIVFEESRTLDIRAELGLDPTAKTTEALMIEGLTFTVDLGKDLLA